MNLIAGRLSGSYRAQWTFVRLLSVPMNEEPRQSSAPQYTAVLMSAVPGNGMVATHTAWCNVANYRNHVKHRGHYMYRQFNIQQFYVLPTQCIYVFCVDLRTNSDYFPIQH